MGSKGWVLILLLSGCTTFDDSASEAPISATFEQQSSTSLGRSIVPAPKSKKRVKIDEVCLALPGGADAAQPYWLAELGVVITKFSKTCPLSNGRTGYKPSSSVIGMGFPCNGGKGRIDIKGKNYWVPKVVSFVLSTDCPMKLPFSEAQGEIKNILGLIDTTQVLAINPFATQFWEVVGLSDSDLGFSIDLRSPKAKQYTWRQFTEKQPIVVKLYGRENSWGSGRNLFQVDGSLQKVSAYRFLLEIEHVKLLSAEDVLSVKKRCLLLSPHRRCESVF